MAYKAAGRLKQLRNFTFQKTTYLITSQRADQLEDSESALCAASLHPGGQTEWKRVSPSSAPLYYIQEGRPPGGK